MKSYEMVNSHMQSASYDFQGGSIAAGRLAYVISTTTTANVQFWSALAEHIAQYCETAVIMQR